MATKVCSKCGKEKELEANFRKNSRYADGHVTWCDSCRKEYYEQHKHDEDRIQHQKEYAQQYYIDNKEKINERNNNLCRKKWKEDPEYRNRKNKQKCANVKKLLTEDPERRKAYTLACTHRKKLREYYFKGAGKEQWDELCKRHDYRCACCGEKKKLTIDHVIPTIKGGTDDISNIQPLCKSCNGRKCDDTTDYRIK